MKLVVVQMGGAVAENQELFARLHAISGWDVTLIVPRRFRDEAGLVQHASRWPAFKGTFIASRVIAAPRIMRRGRNIPLHWYVPSLARVFGRERPDALFVELDSYCAATFQAVRANERTGNVPIGFVNLQNIDKRRPWPFTAMERHVHRSAAFGFARTPKAAEVLRRSGYEGPLELLPLGIAAGRYRAARARRPGSDGALTVGYVGRLVPEKGVETLLDALALTPADSTRAVIVGDGPIAGDLMRRAADNGLDRRIDWRGFLPAHETPVAYASVDVLAVPSRTTAHWKEQFGRVVIEAMASGVPVIASDSGELPYIIERTGGGWLFPEDDAGALARQIEQAASDRAELRRRGAQGQQAVENLFDLDAVAGTLIETIETALARG
jgi:L-malate glycosyltransferase